jgi:ubiquinone/menaquinone biosynthesis C-methylase UbiE
VPDVTAGEANRAFYAETAETYDASEECVVDPRLRRRLRDALEHALAFAPPNPRVLDACGGSGNVSLTLLDLGVRPITVDISPEMLAVYERKARASRHEAESVISEIGAFLERDERDWDVIVFSSALHHLEDYRRTLALAIRRLAPGGVLVTIFDPVPAGPLGRKLRRVEYAAHVVVRTPDRVPELVARRLPWRSPPSARSSSVGNLAERHALHGVDDLELRDLFESAGLDVIVHERTHDGRFALTRGLWRLLRHPSSFHFLVRRPAPRRGAHAPTPN